MIGHVVLIDKEAGPTSHDIVQRLRRSLGERRVGHTGTLDPFATGLVVCCVGPATRLASYIADFDKVYMGRVRLGVATDTLDGTGKVVREAPIPADWRARLDEAVSQWTGAVEQVPPMVSAVRVGGTRLYELARAGVEFTPAPRQVMIHDLQVVAPEADGFAIRVRCSKGTYIRSLAADLGEALGTAATLIELRRIAIGPLAVDRAVASQELETMSATALLEVAAITPFAALGSWPVVTLATDAARGVRHGVAPSTAGIEAVDRPVASGSRVRLVETGGDFIAIAESHVDLQPGSPLSGAPSDSRCCRLLRVLAA